MPLRTYIPFLVCAGLIFAGISHLFGEDQLKTIILMITVVVGALPLIFDITISLFARKFGVDLLAIVAIISAAMLGQYVAAAVILLMLSGGEALESYALRRARKDFTDLIANAPSHAHKKVGQKIIEVSVQEVVPGDVVIVKAGELIPVDGEVAAGISSVNESTLTGEAIPARKVKGSAVMSGSLNESGVLEITVLKPSAESRYEQIIRLVQEAEQKRAPFVRLADRYSVWFTAIAFSMAALAYAISHDPLRFLTVLVVSTPCPLILATPIAFASGISRAARDGIIIKSGGALEKLAQVVCLVFDKTGTLTFGVPQVVKVSAFNMTENDVIHLAASVDQLSAHVLAKSLKEYAHEKGIELFFPEEFHETLGEGVKASYKGETYYVGRLKWLEKQGVIVSEEAAKEHDGERELGRMAIHIARGQTLIGGLFLEDTIRDDVKKLFASLPSLGIKKIVMLTGDKAGVADRIGHAIGINHEDIFAEYLPEQKVAEVERLKKEYTNVAMVGDGINDAPALATANIGIAMGARGSSAASEAGDIVILVDKVERVANSLYLGQRVLFIAKQSIFIGIGLSIFLMFVALGGFITPVVGALMQEIIDVVVILNALRVLFIKDAAA